MRLASVAASAFVFALAASATQAETWVHTRDNGSGYPMCFDKDSPKLGADNLTHYAIKMCQDPTPQWYAVDCKANFKVDLVVRIYDRRDPTRYVEMVVDDPQSGMAGRDPTRYVEMVVDDPQSGMAVDAAMACHK